MTKEELLRVLELDTKVWGKMINPAMLYAFPQEFHELIMDKLPQIAAIARRKQGAKLRVQAIGFNVFIKGTDPELCPYEFDFCVRANGVRAAVTLLLEVKPGVLPIDEIAKLPDSFWNVMEVLARAKRLRISDFNLVLLKTYRPASPGAFQLGTVGGTMKPGESALVTGKREAKEELDGFTSVATEQILVQQQYQSGNVAELQDILVALGYIKDRSKVNVQSSEGIASFHPIALDEVLKCFDDITSDLWDHAKVWVDSKVDHGARKLLWGMHKRGFK